MVLAVCMTLKQIWINSNRNAFGVNDEESKMPRIDIPDRRMPTHTHIIKSITPPFCNHQGKYDNIKKLFVVKRAHMKQRKYTTGNSKRNKVCIIFILYIAVPV